MKNEFLLLHSNCKIVKGICRSCIYDLQREKYFLIPNALADFFSETRHIDTAVIMATLESENIGIFRSYIDLLLSNELAYYINDLSEIELFPSLSDEWDFPAKISHFIIDYDSNSKHDLLYIVEKFIIPINCRHIQLRFFDNTEMNKLESIIQIINESFVKSVDFVIRFNQNYIDPLINFVKSNKKIRSLILHGSAKNEIISEGNYGYGIITTIVQPILNESHCGFIHPNYFSVNLETYTEALKFNSCLNRKMSIDKKGIIRNCPAMPDDFGFYETKNVLDILQNINFTKYWKIKKDEIIKCKDCEFRYMCTDCRAYTDDPNNDYSAPLKCGYDPYTGVWEEWSTNPLKKQIINNHTMNSSN